MQDAMDACAFIKKKKKKKKKKIIFAMQNKYLQVQLCSFQNLYKVQTCFEKLCEQVLFKKIEMQNARFEIFSIRKIDVKNMNYSKVTNQNLTNFYFELFLKIKVKMFEL
eukprot:TRINITY_DN15662_c0_g1_i19.p9 TRINITY_DN15662_c0_g1~~TRINITY_DN15662_c0_g1_i19.p9  ORF type:complete len:109 (-),score=4.80 TRINITY_DN15662_c0_g1_i19:831-1157(-)